jgi:hypothetical protein
MLVSSQQQLVAMVATAMTKKAGGSDSTITEKQWLGVLGPAITGNKKLY